MIGGKEVSSNNRHLQSTTISVTIPLLNLEMKMMALRKYMKEMTTRASYHLMNQNYSTAWGKKIRKQTQQQVS